MSWRGLATSAVVFVLVAGLYVWVGRRESAPAEARAPRLLRIGPADAVEVVLESANGRVRLVRHDQDEWRLTEPAIAEADPERVAALLDRVAGAEVDRKAGDASEDESRFGLAPPEATLVVDASDGTTRERIRLGARSPVSEHRYVELENGAIVLVDPGLAGALEVDADWFRQRRPIPIPQELIERVRLEIRGFAPFEMHRDGDDWRLDEPWSDRARNSTCLDLVRTLSGLTLERIEDDLPNERPRARVRVSGGGQTRTIEVLGASGRNLRRVRREDGSLGGLVPAWHAEIILEDPSRYLDLRLVYASNRDVLAVEFRRGKDSTTIRRPAPGSPWRREDAPSRPVLDAASVEARLDRLRDLRAIDLGPALQPFDQDGAVVLSGAGGRLGALEYRETEDGPLVVRSTWRPGVILLLEPADRSVLLPPDRESSGSGS